MKFLIDNALSPMIAIGLQQAGFDAVHVCDYGMHASEDIEIFELAAQENRTVVSADTDFGTLLALRQERKPSVILFRRNSNRRPENQLQILLVNLPNLQESIEAGSIIIFDRDRIRIRSLPIDGDED
jgi:predicted nuclease of predicted toxin-antitoxin system